MDFHLFFPRIMHRFRLRVPEAAPKFDKTNELNVYNFYIPFPLNEVAQHVSAHRDQSPSWL